MYLPPNTTSKIQPLDQEVIAPLKQIYKKNTDDDVHERRMEQGTTKNHVKDEIGMAYCINQMMNSWKEVEVNTVRHGWKNILEKYFEDTATTFDTELPKPSFEGVS